MSTEIVSCQWMRPTSVKCDGDSLTAVAGVKDEAYDPFDMPNLPNAFAKVTDAKSATRFAQAYGLLGYGRLSGGDECHADEPLEWVLGQAHCVKFALRLMEALSREDATALRAELERESVGIPAMRTGDGLLDLIVKGDPMQRLSASSALEPAGIVQHVSAWYALSIGVKREVYAFENYDGQTEWETLRNHAHSIIEYLVNNNTRGVRQVLRYGNGRLESCRCFSGLIEVIWYIVGDTAVKVQDGSIVRRCEECGTPFLVTDDRQRFCPPQHLSKTSLCGARRRIRRQRHSESGKGHER